MKYSIAEVDRILSRTLIVIWIHLISYVYMDRFNFDLCLEICFSDKVITKKIAEQVTKRKTNKNTTSWGFSELDHLDKAQQTKEQWLLSNESLIRTKLWIFVKYTARQVVTRLSRMICFYWLRHSRSIPEKVSNKYFFVARRCFCH